MCLPLETVIIHHKDWITYFGGTDEPGELFYNISISNDLTQMVSFPTRIPYCDSPVLPFWIYFHLTIVFVRPWHDTWAIACTCAFTCANQVKGSLAR